MTIELKPGEKRLIDADRFEMSVLEHRYKYFHKKDVIEAIKNEPTVDAVEVVRCKECRFAKPYERMDGKTGYYCQFCGHSFEYGTNCERLYNPIKESDDFCSYGERKEGDGNG